MHVFLNVIIYYFRTLVLETLVYSLVLWWGFFPGSRNSRYWPADLRSEQFRTYCG